MFAGHVGAGLAIARFERRVNVGAFIAAALLLDLVLWVLVLAGVESVRIPADYAATRQPEFVFPWSHGLAAAVGWSVAAALPLVLGKRAQLAHRRRVRAAALIAAAVFSHWLLDALVHRPELPLIGDRSARVGVGLWDALPLALAVEAAIALAGTVLFVSGAGLSRRRTAGMAALVAAVTAFTISGMLLAPAPPSAAAMAGGSLGTLVAVVAVAAWLGRGARREVASNDRAGNDVPTAAKVRTADKV